MTMPESPTIAPTAVVAVLLADGWHRATLGSFTIGALSLGAHTEAARLGYRFEEADDTNPDGPAVLAGPLEAVLAVREITPRKWHHRPTRRSSGATHPRRAGSTVPATPGTSQRRKVTLTFTGVEAVHASRNSGKGDLPW